MLLLHPPRPPSSAPLVSSGELRALAHVLNRAQIALDTREPGMCPQVLLRLLEQDLEQRAAAAEVDEFLLVRAAASLRRPRRWGSWAFTMLTAGRWPSWS